MDCGLMNKGELKGLCQPLQLWSASRAKPKEHDVRRPPSLDGCRLRRLATSEPITSTRSQ